MKPSTIMALTTIAGWTASHFIYQIMFGIPDWSAAIERSFFTIIAQMMMWFSLRAFLDKERT